MKTGNSMGKQYSIQNIWLLMRLTFEHFREGTYGPVDKLANVNAKNDTGTTYEETGTLVNATLDFSILDSFSTRRHIVVYKSIDISFDTMPVIGLHKLVARSRLGHSDLSKPLLSHSRRFPIGLPSWCEAALPKCTQQNEVCLYLGISIGLLRDRN